MSTNLDKFREKVADATFSFWSGLRGSLRLLRRLHALVGAKGSTGAFCFRALRALPPFRAPSTSWNTTKAPVWVLLLYWSGLRGSNPPPPPWQGGALPNELNPRIWCLRSESNQRHGDFQSPALPTELQRQKSLPHKMATRMGLEPTTSSVTG